MQQPKPRSNDRERKDHYVPQGYLRGFIHPEREGHPQPLWVLEIERGEWIEKSASQIGWERGFYDYPRDSHPDATADDAFRALENGFPRIRDRIRTEGYDSWIQHQDRLVDFAAMMAARSPLFRKQAALQIRPSLAHEPNADILAKNYSITLMRTEIQRRSEQWRRYHWALGYTKNPEQPFVAGDQGVGIRSNALTLDEAVQRNDLWLWCPLSWDMCLIGSSQPVKTKPTSELRSEHIAEVQRLTRRQAMVFVASSVPLANLIST